MTALVGIVGPAAGSSDAVIPRMLGAMQNRATGATETFSAPGVCLVARRHDWEASLPGWTGPLIAESASWVIAADASLYYLDDLRRTLARHVIVKREDGTAGLLLGALEVWGERFASNVEGDFALLAWHRPSGRLLAAREFAGKRGLSWSRISDGSVILASSPDAVVAHPGVSRDFDMESLALSAGGLPPTRHRSSWAAVSVVQPGATLRWQEGAWAVVDRWQPPPFGSAWEETIADEAALELRSLLQEATVQRLPASGSASVWMSGGWDSTSILASGRAAAGSGRELPQLIPVSATFPEGDSGNEDQHVRAVLERWPSAVRWVASEAVPLFEDAERHAAVRDDAMAHPFESLLRHLSRASRDCGSRVVLEGHGGDHLFMASGPAVAAQLLFDGRLGHVFRMWRASGLSARDFAKRAVRPLLSKSAMGWLDQVRGRVAGARNNAAPSWIKLGVVARDAVDRLAGEGPAAFEARQLLTSPFLAQVDYGNTLVGLDEGVSIRSPFLDRRLISFAASRPLSDRGAGPDGKRILRLAMRGLLPDSVLGPRGRKTGLTSGYLQRQLSRFLVPESEAILARRTPVLEEVGILDRQRMSAALRQFAASPAHDLGAALLHTLETERWIAARTRSG